VRGVRAPNQRGAVAASAAGYAVALG
jgi:hypothetical protein